jgi:molybdopterin converting factor small subunit
VADLRAELDRLHPPLAAIALRIAVDRAFASPDRVLSEGAEAALIPPVAGG